MKQGMGFALLGVLLLALAGCGGAGGSASPAALAGNPYQGHWIGTWEDDHNNYGPLQVWVKNDGSFDLSINNDYAGGIGSGTGHIKTSGALTANYSFDISPPLTAAGTVMKADATHLDGNLVTKRNGVVQANSTVSLRLYGS